MGENTLIFGPSGTGKTTLARFVVRELERETLDLRWGYHNCISGSSKSEVLFGIMRDAGLGADLRKTGSPTSSFLDRLRESDRRVVVIIDEVDVLEDDTTLQALYEIPNVTIVAITIDEDDLFAHLDSRVQSRFRSAETIHLERFTHDQLVDILQARIRAGLRPGTISSDAIDYIADVAAGDAREAIGILRSGARASRGMMISPRSRSKSSTITGRQLARRFTSSGSKISGHTSACYMISSKPRARYLGRNSTGPTSSARRTRRPNRLGGSISTISRKSMV